MPPFYRTLENGVERKETAKPRGREAGTRRNPCNLSALRFAVAFAASRSLFLSRRAAVNHRETVTAANAAELWDVELAQARAGESAVVDQCGLAAEKRIVGRQRLHQLLSGAGED